MTFDKQDLAAQTALRQLKKEIQTAEPATLRLLLTEARTINTWTDQEVSVDTLKDIYEIIKMGPTSANSCPARLIFLKSSNAKERLRKALKPNNVDKTMNAPVTVIVGYDIEFWTHAEKTFPQSPATQQAFKDNPSGSQIAAFRNGSLQGAYFIIAARALGLDCGPMSGIDYALVDEEFFAGTTFRSNFLCNLGYGDINGTFKRLPCHEFNDVCKVF